MDVLFQATDGVGRVLMEEIGQQHRIHVVFDKVVEIIIDGDVLAQFFLGSCHTVRTLFANGNDLGTVLQESVHIGRTPGIAENTDSNLIHVVFLLTG